MTAQQAKYADSYTCSVCAEASEGSEESSAVCSDFASDPESDVDSDGSGLQFRRPDGTLNGGSDRKAKSGERKEKRRLKDPSLKDRLSSQPPSGGKPRLPPAIPVAGGCTKNALCTRYFRHPGLCKPAEGRFPKSISKPEARDGPPSSGRAGPKPQRPRSRAVSPTQQCHKNKNCPRGYRHPGASRRTLSALPLFRPPLIPPSPNRHAAHAAPAAPPPARPPPIPHPPPPPAVTLPLPPMQACAVSRAREAPP